MRIKYINRELATKSKLTKESYEVLAYGQYNETLKIFLFPNDDLEIYDMDQSSVEVIDSDLNDYERIDKLNGGRELYIKSNLIKHLDQFKNTGDIKSNHCWNKSKLAGFFLLNNYEIPESYKIEVLNENYKFNLIQGFLHCVNVLLINKNGGSNIQEEFYFSISDSELGYLKEEPKFEMQKEEFPNDKFKSIIMEFTKETIPEASKNISIELYKLIDSIFIRKITNLKKIYNWYEEVICVEYENKYYSLRKFSGS